MSWTHCPGPAPRYGRRIGALTRREIAALPRSLPWANSARNRRRRRRDWSSFRLHQPHDIGDRADMLFVSLVGRDRYLESLLQKRNQFQGCERVENSPCNQGGGFGQGIRIFSRQKLAENKFFYTADDLFHCFSRFENPAPSRPTIGRHDWLWLGK